MNGLMKKTTILLLRGGKEVPPLEVLDGLRERENIVVGDSADAFRSAAGEAEVIFNWSGGLPLFREVFLMCPKLRWVHSRSAGLERSLFPELVAKDIPLTNGSGVFSPSLGEFTLAAVLYFAKDFRRMSAIQSPRSATRPLLLEHCGDTLSWSCNKAVISQWFRSKVLRLFC